MKETRFSDDLNAGRPRRLTEDDREEQEIADAIASMARRDRMHLSREDKEQRAMGLLILAIGLVIAAIAIWRELHH